MFCAKCGSPLANGSCPQCALNPRANSSTPDHTYLVFIHLAAFSGIVLPFGTIVGPLILWLLKREERPDVDRHGKSVLNFHLSWSLWMLVLGALAFGASFGVTAFMDTTLSIRAGVGMIALAGVVALTGLFSVVCAIVGAVKAANGELFEYPLKINWLK